MVAMIQPKPKSERDKSMATICYILWRISIHVGKRVDKYENEPGPME